MRKQLYLFFGLLIFVFQFGQAQPIEALRIWLKQNPDTRNELTKEAFAQQALSREDAQIVSKILDSLWRKEKRNRYLEAMKKGVLTWNDLQMKLGGKTYGEKPVDGYSLYISMHGGGSAPAQLNDQQWRNQIHLYRPKEGVYIAPRAPWDDWNMWFKSGVDEFFEQLIQAAVALMEVNPDKVYLLGYSAGGDGVWRMAPRMADRWAAAAMMAGHPGEASQVNLRNTPFMIWMGEQDAAYDRNVLAVKHGKIMDSLQQADPSGYIHETHIILGKGHWMDRADTAAISWMAQYRRNPWPQKVVWRQEEVTRPVFYWVEAPIEECHHQDMVVVEYENNTIDISHCDYTRLTFGLNDQMVNLDRPIVVRYRGKKLFKGKVKRTIAQMSMTLEKRSDLRYMFPAVLEVKLP